MSGMGEALKEAGKKETRARKCAPSLELSIVSRPWKAGAFLSVDHFPNRRFQNLIRFCCLTRWGPLALRLEKLKAHPIIRTADSRL